MTQARVADLVARASTGDQQAWDALVDRFLPLVTSVISRFRLSQADAEDVNQTVWLRLVEHLDDLREPGALPGWLVTTTRNEALRLVRKVDRQRPTDPLTWHGHDAAAETSIDDLLLSDERHHALVDGLGELRPESRELLLLLLSDPPLSYAEIGGRLGRPVGSIGPTRARVLAELRATPAMRRLLDAEPDLRRR
jgi:RNA polymerase sigma factor (sigma-70 family)